MYSNSNIENGLKAGWVYMDQYAFTLWIMALMVSNYRFYLYFIDLLIDIHIDILLVL